MTTRRAADPVTDSRRVRRETLRRAQHQLEADRHGPVQGSLAQNPIAIGEETARWTDSDPQPEDEPQDRQRAGKLATTRLEQPVTVVKTAKAEDALRTASVQGRRGDPGPDRLDGVDGEALFEIP